MARSVWLTRAILAAGVASSLMARASVSLADDHHEGREEHGERGDHDNRGRPPEHAEYNENRAYRGGGDYDRGRYAGQDWRHDEHEHRGVWGARAFPFGWGGGPSVTISPPAPYVPPPRYEPPYDYRAPYYSPSPYDYGPRGYDPGYDPGNRWRSYPW